MKRIVCTPTTERLTRQIQALRERGLVAQVGTAPDGEPIWGLTKLAEEFTQAGGKLTDFLEDK